MIICVGDAGYSVATVGCGEDRTALATPRLAIICRIAFTLARAASSGHVLAADVLGLGVLAFEREDQREVVAHPNVGVRAGAGFAQRRLGLGQLLGQRVGQSEIVEQEGLARRDLERVGVEFPRAVMVAQFVLDRALHGHDRPVGPILWIGARQHVLGLRQVLRSRRAPCRIRREPHSPAALRPPLSASPPPPRCSGSARASPARN